MNDPIVWNNSTRKISELKPADYNPRKSTEKEYNDLKKSIEKFSEVDPIIINADDTVIGGHFRLRLYGDIKKEVCEVRVPSRLLTKPEEIELNIRLNKNVGLWDWDKLANFDESDLKDFGFTDNDFGNLLSVEDYSDIEKKSEELSGLESVSLVFEIPVKFKDQVVAWITDGDSKADTRIALGKGILRKCGLL